MVYDLGQGTLSTFFIYSEPLLNLVVLILLEDLFAIQTFDQVSVSHNHPSEFVRWFLSVSLLLFLFVDFLVFRTLLVDFWSFAIFTQHVSIV